MVRKGKSTNIMKMDWMVKLLKELMKWRLNRIMMITRPKYEVYKDWLNLKGILIRKELVTRIHWFSIIFFSKEWRWIREMKMKWRNGKRG